MSARAGPLDEAGLRLECLRLSVAVPEHWQHTVERAQAYFDFITGASAMSPREAINAALDAANVS
ncbi:MAG: hypothetical protein ACTHOJ_17675 [Sphingomonas oligoaromativorans]